MILFGFKGCGKSHFGKLLAAKLHLPFIDTDELLGGSPSHLYRTLGETRFRMLEKEALLTLQSGCVIALGGGTVLDPSNVELLLKIGKLIYLEASFETIARRIKITPAFAEGTSLHTLYQARKPIYESIPAVRIQVNPLDPESVLAQMMEIYGI